MSRLALSLLCLLCAGATQADGGKPTAEVRFSTGFSKPQAFDHAALAALPRTPLEVTDHGTKARFEGVEMVHLLRTAGAPLDQALRGAQLSKCVRVSAADGYQVVFALAEFDPLFGNSQAILADRRDGKALDAKEGPFRLVIPREQRAGRWVRQVNNVQLLDCGGTPGAAHPAH